MRKRTKIEPPDVYLLGTALALLAVGVLLVFDASYAKSGDLKTYGFDTWYFAKRQLTYAGVGLLFMFIASVVPMDFLRKMSIPLMVVVGGLLVAVLLPGIGARVNGARSWFKLGPISVQPSELAKIALVLYLARVLGRPRIFARGAQPRWTIPLWAAMGLIGLVVIENDMGSAVVLSSIVFVMFALAGAKKLVLVPIAVTGIALVVLAMCTVSHCKDRVDAFKDPWGNRYGKGYQIVHSLIGFGTGGLTGVGLCEGRVKSYIPAASTDYIYATLAEETGLTGSLVLLGMFAFLAYRGLKVARRCASPFAALVVAGITSAVSIQALINLAVATNSIPATGIPLPFISYGGSSLVIMLTGVGILLSVSRQLRAQIEDQEADEDSSNRRRHRRSHLSGYQRGSGASGTRSYGRTAVRR